MRDPQRIDLLVDAVREAWRLSPDLRLAQLLHAVVDEPGDLFHMEDDVLLGNLELWIRRRARTDKKGRQP